MSVPRRESGASLAGTRALLTRACRARGEPRRRAALAAARAARAARRAGATSARARELEAAAYSILAKNWTARRLMEEEAAKGDAGALLLLARLSWKEHPEEALRCVERALAAEPGHGAARCFRGELLRRAGRAREAFDELSAGLALGGSDGRARVWLAKSALALGLRERAFAEFDRARRASPRRARIAAERGFALEGAGELRAAERDYGEALRLEASGPLDLDETIETAESTPEMLAWLHFRRFAVRLRRGNAVGGLEDLGRAHALDLKYAWRGRAEERDGLTMEELTRALEKGPDEGWLHAWRGQALNRDGRPAEAVEALDRAIRLGAGGAWPRAWRAEALLRLGRDADARADARRAQAQEARYPLLAGLNCELSLRRDAFAAARRHARRAIGAYPHAAWAYGLLGEALLGLGRREEARRALDQALAWSPDYRTAALLRALTFLDFRGRPPEPLFRILRKADQVLPRDPDAGGAAEIPGDWRDGGAAASLKRLIASQPKASPEPVLVRLRALSELLRTREPALRTLPIRSMIGKRPETRGETR